MKLLSTLFLTLLALSLTTRATHAQLSAYGIFSATDYGYQNDYSSVSYIYPYNVSYSDGDLSFSGYHAGFGGGLMYTVINRAVSLSIDARDTYTPALSGGNSAAISFRAGFVPERYVCHPYVQLGPGIIHERIPATYFGPARSQNTAAVAFGFGLDVRASPSVSIRAIEFAYLFGGSGSSQLGSISVNTGVVYHIPHTR